MENINWLELSIIVHPKKGTTVKFKVDPKVEEFFKGFVSPTPNDGNGMRIYSLFEGWGRGFWCDPDEETSPFDIYPIPGDGLTSSSGYTLNNVSGELIDKKSNKVNLSFLRIVGASGPHGTSFKYIPARTKDYWQAAQNEIGRQFRNFCEDFIVPYTVSLKVIS